MELKLEVGKSYKTRGGLKAGIDRFEEDWTFPFRGKVYANGEYLAGFSWLPNGASKSHTESRFDLIAPWTEPETASADYQSAPAATKSHANALLIPERVTAVLALLSLCRDDPEEAKRVIDSVCAVGV